MLLISWQFKGYGHAPAPVASLMQHEADGADDDEKQEYLLLPHFTPELEKTDDRLVRTKHKA